MVDEVAQFQQVAAVPRITEHYMVPVLEALVSAFPFRVLAFHADNGSEYINHLPFLNHHRACLFAIEVEGEGGRQRRKYPQLVMTPYEKLRSLPAADGFLKPGITFAQLGKH